MKKFIFVFVVCTLCLISFSFFYFAKANRSGTSRDIVLQFVTYNGYGNNLYIDNVLTGIQQNTDITVTSFVNIPYGTIYSTKQSGIDTVTPIITVSNIGRTQTADSTVKVFLEINPGGYLDSAFLPGLGSGITIQNTFTKKFIYTIGTGYNLKAYTSYSADTNRTNDTLNQYSISLPGYRRMVLFEEFTSNNSPACANNNTPLNQFINRNFLSVAAIKYHTGLLGNDTFYTQNPLQQSARMRYYYVSSVPTTIVDGGLPLRIPYGDSANLYNPYNSALSKGTPVSISVLDENVSADSIRATVNINVISPIPPGNYILSINAVERFIQLDTQANHETQFYDVFRENFPDSNGIQIQTGIGSYQYQYTYYIKPDWVDSMIYTIAYIQNSYDREILNCAKGRNVVVNTPSDNNSRIVYGKSDLLNVNYDYRNHNPGNILIDTIQTALNVELFESYFPPIGWSVFNQDGFITFQQFPAANGPTIGGNKSVIMDFFDYNIIGQRDSMYSKVYRNLLSIDTVRFDYAYAQYTTLGTNIDSLTVKVSTDGGLTFPAEIFRKGGLALSTAPQTTSFFIPSVASQWRSFKFSLNGIVSIDDNFSSVPSKFLLDQNYPNPFNPNTIIRYELPVAGFVSLKVYDILGKEIITLLNEKQSTGIHQVNFNGSDLSSGIYFYQLKTDGFSDTKRMVLLK